MSGITPEALIRFFEETQGVCFIDTKTGKLVTDLLEESRNLKSAQKSDFELWLEGQDEATKLEHQMGAI